MVDIGYINFFELHYNEQEQVMNNEGVVRVWCTMCDLNSSKSPAKITMANNYNSPDCIFIATDTRYLSDIMKTLSLGFGSNLRGTSFQT